MSPEFDFVPGVEFQSEEQAVAVCRAHNAVVDDFKERIRELELELKEAKETADRMMDESEARGQRIEKAREILETLDQRAYIIMVKEALAALEGK